MPIRAALLCLLLVGCPAPLGPDDLITPDTDTRVVGDSGAPDGCAGCLLVYTDGDGDGYGDPDTVRIADALAVGEVEEGGDCDDSDPLIAPGAEDVCDGVDNNCDFRVDEGAPSWYRDRDGDGLGEPDEAVVVCEPPHGYVDNNLDRFPDDSASNALRLVRLLPAQGAAVVLGFTAAESGEAEVWVSVGLAADECGSNDGVSFELQSGRGDILLSGDQATAGPLSVYREALMLEKGDELRLMMWSTIDGSGDNYCDWGSASFTVRQGSRYHDAGHDFLSALKGTAGVWSYLASPDSSGELAEMSFYDNDTESGWRFVVGEGKGETSEALLYLKCEQEDDQDCDLVRDADDAFPDSAHEWCDSDDDGVGNNEEGEPCD